MYIIIFKKSIDSHFLVVVQYADNLEVWIKEAQGVITRTRLEDPMP
ncbi:hypothetical protein [Helicobacter bilis]|nr:hypothetical protein [Helicobacter bilis]